MMEESIKDSSVSTAPQQPEKETETKVQVPEVEEHAEEQEKTTQPTSEAHVEEKESGKVQDDTTEPEDYKTKFERLSEKISGIEKEKNEYLQKVKLLEALDSAAASDPEFMKLANKKLVEQGVLDESVLAELEQQTATQPQGANVASAVTSDPAIAWAKQKMQEEQKKREEFFENFEKDRPDLAEGDREIVRANRQAVSAAAIRRMKAGEPMEKAYDYAYKQIMHPEQLIEEGKLEGIAQAQSATPAVAGASGGSSQTSGKAELTPEQREAARLFGIAEEKYSQNLEE